MADGTMRCDLCYYSVSRSRDKRDERIDLISLPLTDEEIAAIQAGEVVKIRISADPVLGTDRDTLVAIRRRAARIRTIWERSDVDGS